MKYYEIAPLSKTRRELYTYGCQSTVPPGTVVQIPFGPRKLHGVVWRKTDRMESARMVTVITSARLSPIQMRLAQWLSEEYLTPLGICLKTILNSSIVRQAPSRVKPAGSVAITEPASPAVMDRVRRLSAYVQEVRTARGNGKKVLIVVPEILDIQRLLASDSQVFQQPAVWHSKLKTSERTALWWSVASGDIDLMLATRSALLLPWSDLGLIIIDEEDDLAYKQEQAPRYHARALAAVAARHYGARLVYGSAAPSLEVYVPLLEGKYVRPPSSRGDETDGCPSLRFVRPGVKPTHSLPHELSEALRQASGNRRVALYAPHRFHASLARQLNSHFPRIKLGLLGSDGPANVRNVRKFKQGALDVLLGGQQLGRDWELEVESMFMLEADTLLQLPDFRAGEKAHAMARKLWRQVPPDGQFVIHTATPDHPAWTMLRRPYGEWVRHELNERQSLQLPPCNRLTRIVFSDADGGKAERQARQAADILTRHTGLTVSVGPAPVPEVKSRSRWEVLIKGDPKALKGHLDEAWAVDVDPLTLL